jgi:hypothetical protein
MTLTSLKIDLDRLAEVLGRESAPRSSSASSKVHGEAARRRRKAQPVEAVVIESTGERYRGCSCHEHGLYAGMTVQRLIEMDGCRVAFACPRLDAIRRHYDV